jgi:hypothetical protein
MNADKWVLWARHWVQLAGQSPHCQVHFHPDFHYVTFNSRNCPPCRPAATLIYQVRHDELDRVLAALPALVVGARPASHRSHRKWASKEIAEFHPADALQALLAGYIVVLRHVVVSTRSAADLGPLTPAQVCRQERSAAKLIRAAKYANATPRREQKRATRRGGARSGDGFGSAAPNAFGRNVRMRRGAQGLAEVASPLTCRTARAAPRVKRPGVGLGPLFAAQPAERTRRTNAPATEPAE